MLLDTRGALLTRAGSVWRCQSRATVQGPCGSVPGPSPGPEPCCGLTPVAAEVAAGPGAPHACSGLHRHLAELRRELYLWNTGWYLTTMHYKMMVCVRHCCYLTPLCFNSVLIPVYSKC